MLCALCTHSHCPLLAKPRLSSQPWLWAPMLPLGFQLNCTTVNFGTYLSVEYGNVCLPTPTGSCLISRFILQKFLLLPKFQIFLSLPSLLSFFFSKSNTSTGCGSSVNSRLACWGDVSFNKVLQIPRVWSPEPLLGKPGVM